MIRYFLTIVLVLHLNLIQAQNISIEDSLQIENQIEKEEELLKQKLLKENKPEHQIQFTIDTFKIEKRMDLRLEIDYSTAGMLVAGGNTTDDYDHLLNKYYGQLLKVLDKEDQPIFQQAQRDWITYRDSELEFNGTFTAYKNTGGATMFGPLALSRVLEITRQRVQDIYSYLHLILITRA